jgi:signal transduction histidine kinase/CheY-like chemotaxis protein
MADTESSPQHADFSEEHRLAALRSYRILDTPPEADFDDITRIISHICQTPIAVVSLIDADRQFFKSEIGLGVRETALDVSICAHAIRGSDTLIVPDAQLDPRFATNPLVTGQPGLRFYAGALLKAPDGQPVGTLCVLDYVARELTDVQVDALQSLARQVMKQLELRRALAEQAVVMADREKTRQELERTIHVKDQFLAELSHELRSPLNPVLMTATALEQDPQLAESFREDMRLIRRNVELEVRLIDDLLDLTRISRQKVELRPAPVRAVAELQHTVNMCRPDAQAKRLTVDCHQFDTQDTLHADPARLHQIFANLLRNAIKFTPDGGTISITTSNGPNDNWTLAIKDTGIGIEADRLPAVFNAYEQGDRTITRRFGGLGLGLAITKALVEMQGGTITAASDGLGLGATFTVSFPISRLAVSPAPAAGPPDASLVAEPPSRRVLLVEDNQATARVMTRLLRQMSHQVALATDMASALEAAGTRPFDLMISDVGLPDGSGLDLMREIKKQYGIPGIAVTGYGMEEDIRRCRDAGFIAHLTKPISATQLEHAIAQLP